MRSKFDGILVYSSGSTYDSNNLVLIMQNIDGRLILKAEVTKNKIC